MIAENIKRVLNKWRMKQSRLGEITGTNRGQINSYLRGTNPSVDFIISLEKHLGYRFTVEELWKTAIDYDKIPAAPVMNAVRPDPAGGSKEIDISAAFERIRIEMEQLRSEVDALQEEE